MPFDDKAFAIEKFKEYTIDDVINRGDADTPAGARRFLANKLKSTVFGVQTSELNKTDINKYAQVAGVSDITKAQGSLIYDGATIANFYYDGTDKTYKAERGKDLCFDTVTGKSLTGVHPSWAGDEYVTVAIALESCEKIGITQIPVKFKTPVAPKRLHTFPFKNDSGEIAPTGAVMSQKGLETIDGVSYIVIEKPKSSVYNPPWCINVGDPVANQKFGTACYLEDDPGQALYEVGAATPPWDEQVGPAPGSWELKKAYPGFKVIGPVEGGLITVVQRTPQILLAYSKTGTINAATGETTYGVGVANVYAQTGATYFDTGFAPTVYNPSKQIVKANRRLHLVNVMGVFWHVNFEDCAVGA